MLSKEQSARVDALKAERDELIERLMKLYKFIHSGKIGTISEAARTLLLAQRDIMEQYVCILNKRITQFVVDCIE